MPETRNPQSQPRNSEPRTPNPEPRNAEGELGPQILVYRYERSKDILGSEEMADDEVRVLALLCLHIGLYCRNEALDSLPPSLPPSPHSRIPFRRRSGTYYQASSTAWPMPLPRSILIKAVPSPATNSIRSVPTPHTLHPITSSNPTPSTSQSSNPTLYTLNHKPYTSILNRTRNRVRLRNRTHRTRTHAHARTHARARAHTHTHTHTCQNDETCSRFLRRSQMPGKTLCWSWQQRQSRCTI